MNRITMNRHINLQHFTQEELYEYLGSYLGFEFYIDKEDPEYINIDVVDPNKLNRHKQKKRVMELCLSESMEFKNSWHVDSVRLDCKYQRQGLGAKFYAYIIRKLGIQLQAGHQQSPGGRALWCSLAKRSDLMVYGKTKHGRPMIMVENEERELVPMDGRFDSYNGNRPYYMFAAAVATSL